MAEDKENNSVTKKEFLNLKKALENNKNKSNNGISVKTLYNGIITLSSINKELKTFNKISIETNKTLINEVKKLNRSFNKKDEDIFKKKDPNALILNELERGNIYAKSNLKLQQGILEGLKDKGKGLLGLLGGLAGLAVGGSLIGGGFLGYLVTGKKEFLNDLWKGILKYSPIKLLVKAIDGGFNLLVKPLIGKIGKFGYDIFSKGIGKIAETGLGKNIGKLFGKVIGNNLKGVKSVFSIISKAFGGFGKMMGKGVGKVIGNNLKGVKSVFSIISKAFGGFGKMMGKGVGKVVGKGFGKAALKKIPVLGALMGLMFGIDRFKQGDWVGGLLEVGSGIASIIPVAGTAISLAIDGFLVFRDFKKIMPNNEKKNVERKKFDVKNIPVIGDIVKMMESINKGDVLSVALTASKFIPGVGAIVDVFSFLKGKFTDKSKLGSGFKLQNNKVNVTGLNSDLFDRFKEVAEEYKLLTGQDIQINSGYRSYEEQKALRLYYESIGKKGYAAHEGTSNHEFGNAIDINTIGLNMDLLDKLLEKRGLDRPLKNSSKPEAWHIEMKKDVRVAEPKSNESNYLPNNRVEEEKKKNEPLVLSDSTLDKLAEKIGYQFKKNLPEVKTGTIGNPVVVRK